MAYDPYGLAAKHYGINIDANGTAINPKTGQRELVYAIAPDDPLQGDWSNFKFASDGGLTPQHQGLTGWAPGYYTDKPSTFDNFMERGTLAGLMAIGGAAAGGFGAAGAGAEGGLAGEAGVGSLVGSAGADTLGSEAALGGGLTAGTTASGIGGGATGTGVTAGAGASGIGVAGAGGSLAPGFFAGETAYPVIGGASGVGSLIGNGGATAAAGGTTALGRLLSGGGTTADYASLLGNLGIAGLGYYGASRQGDSLAGIAAENRADRMPFYAKSLEYLNNPSAYASGPGQAALQANLRALSVNGNPADNPALLGIATSSALRDWRDAVTGFGNIGLSGSDTRASLMSGATNADANALNALGYGIGSTLNPPSTIEQLLKQLKGAGVGLA